MIKRAAIILLATTALFAGTAAADVGAFTSFTTTLTSASGVAVIDVELETTGGAPSSSDEVYVDFYFVNQTDGSYGWDGAWMHRDGTGNTFSDSYTFAVPANRFYKWSVSTDTFQGAIGSATQNYFSSLFDAWYYGYYSPFFNSTISSASVIINVYAPLGPGPGPAPEGGQSGIFFANNLFVGFAGAHAPNLLEIPTLGEWGMLVLGASLLGFGLLALRRSA